MMRHITCVLLAGAAFVAPPVSAQELTDNLGAFLRVCWDDDNNETWAFTEVDRSAAVGLSASADRWGRKQDTLAAVIVVNGLSGPHRRYLAAGGYGFLIGDGALSFGP